MNDPIVIIGSGLAGISVARELRKLDKETPLIVVTADDGVFYSKPNLSNALAAGKSAAQLALAPAAQLAEQLGIELLTQTRIERILPVEHILASVAGPIAYRKLVLAIGAWPIRLPLAGDGADDVLAVNNLADYAAFHRHLAGKRRVAILGAGLIGCEFANDLRNAGIDVDIFDLAPQPLGRLLPPQSAAFFRDRIAAVGVNFHFSTSIVEITRSGSAYRLTDNHGVHHDADLVLSAVGLKPSIELAQGAGLAVNRGIVVDKTLRTSDPDIFTLGDCAEVGGLLLPFVMPIMQAARALARTLAAPDAAPAEVAYPAMPVVVKTPGCPTVVCPPPIGAAGTWREQADTSGVRGIFDNDKGIQQGFVLLGEAIKEKQTLVAQMPAWL
jgi:rubredoxin-NAD+ reductase